MSVLGEQIKQTLLPGMVLPLPLEMLFAWIETNRFYIDTDEGYRIGFLYRDDDNPENLAERERAGGTDIEFFAEGNRNIHYWFGKEEPDILNRLCVFARTGADGSMAAFWLAPDGSQKIVHMGSGSGSTLVCVLADDPIDFIRLLAIGYDEICWREQFSAPPNDGLSVGWRDFYSPELAIPTMG